MRSKSAIIRVSGCPEAITRLISLTTRSMSARARASVSARAAPGSAESPSADAPAAITNRRVSLLVIRILQRGRCGGTATCCAVIGIGVALARRAAKPEPAILQIDRARLCVAVLALVENLVDRLRKPFALRQARGNARAGPDEALGAVQHVGERVGEQVHENPVGVARRRGPEERQLDIGP